MTFRPTCARCRQCVTLDDVRLCRRLGIDELFCTPCADDGTARLLEAIFAPKLRVYDAADGEETGVPEGED